MTTKSRIIHADASVTPGDALIKELSEQVKEEPTTKKADFVAVVNKVEEFNQILDN